MSDRSAPPPVGTGRTGLMARLLGAQALVLLAGAATTWVVAASVAPGIFHDHLVQAGVGHTVAEADHVELAFADSLLIALGVALVTSVLLALAVTAWFTRRVQRSTGEVVAAADRIAHGEYDSRVPSPGLGPEFDQLATTVNDLAARLGAVETTRRRILADLAHEMRTPLATIEAHLEAVEDGVRDLDDQTLAVLHQGTARLHRLAEDIGAVSRVEEGQLESRPARRPAADLVETASAAAADAFRAAGVRLVVDASPPGPMVLVDPERIGQVLGNLLENALRHTPAGGEVRLTTGGTASAVEIVVTDTGEGITAEHLGHVFERFYRADTSRTRSAGGGSLGGSGIGLTISRALVQAHGGTLTAASGGHGHGATFTVTLPAASR